LSALAAQARTLTRWVRAHDGHPYNELVDALALEAKLTR
jgi:ribonuclease HI